jgi:transcriptional regulator with XRE-family HTH domain
VGLRFNIGERLRAERQARNLSQADIERRVGLPRCRISWLELGRATPTLETLERLAEALDVPIERFFHAGVDAESSEKPQKGEFSGKGPRSGAAEAISKELQSQLLMMREEDRNLLLYIARGLAKRGAEKGHANSRRGPGSSRPQRNMEQRTKET